MKPAAALLALLFAGFTCLLAVVGIGHLMHWLDARPDFVATTQPLLFLTTIALAIAAGIRWRHRKAD
jgi:hypothetical protein